MPSDTKEGHYPVSWMAVAANGKLLVIPTRNIKYIEVTPAPDSLRDTIIRDADVS